MSDPILDAILTSNEAALRPERALIFYTRGSALELVTAHDVRDTRAALTLWQAVTQADGKQAKPDAKEGKNP